MERFRDYLRNVSMPLSDAALFSLALYHLPTLTKTQTVAVDLGAWVIFLLLLVLVNEFMTGVRAPVNLYFIVNAAGIAAGSLLTVRNSACFPELKWFPVCLACCVAVTGIHCAAVSVRPPKANNILRYADGLVVITAFYLYAVYQTGLEWDRGVLILGIGAIVLDLTAVNQVRIREEGVSVIRGSGAGSRLALGALTAGILCLTGAIVGFASGRIHSLVDLVLFLAVCVGRVIGAVFGAISGVLGNILRFLLMLLPDAPLESGGETVAAAAGAAEEEVTREPTALPLWAGKAAVAVLLLCLVVWILLKFRRVRLKRPERGRKTVRTVRTSHFLESVREQAGRLAAAAVFEVQYRKNRKTPEGLFVLAERTGRRKRIIRKKDESPGAYVRRLAERDGQDRPAGIERLDHLAEILDQVYYGEGGRTLSPEEYRSYAQAVKEFI